MPQLIRLQLASHPRQLLVSNRSVPNPKSNYLGMSFRAQGEIHKALLLPLR